MKWKALSVGLALALITGIGVAQTSNQTQDNMTQEIDLDTVIVASDDSYLDPAIADVAADRYGVPVALTSPDNLTSSTEEAVSQAERAVIVGGPAAVSEDVKSSLEAEVDQVNRVWGETATDTSLEVSEYFWPDETDQATVVQTDLFRQEDAYHLLSSVVNTAEDPVILSDENVSEEMISNLENQEIEEVTVYSTTQESEENEGIFGGNESENTTNTENNESADLEERFDEADISADVNRGDIEELTSDLNEDLEAETLFATTGINFSYGIPSYAHPDAAVYPVQDSQIDQDIEFVNESDFSQVNVIGEEAFGQQIMDELNNTENRFIEVEDTAETSVQILRNQSSEWETMVEEDLVEDLEFPEATENETEEENQTDNETETPVNQTGENETEANESVSSSVSLTSVDNDIEAEASYSDGEAYTKSGVIRQNQTHIEFVFELAPADEEVEETTYDFQQQLSPEEGEYETSVSLVVDGETVRQSTENITIT